MTPVIHVVDDNLVLVLQRLDDFVLFVKVQRPVVSPRVFLLLGPDDLSHLLGRHVEVEAAPAARAVHPNHRAVAAAVGHLSIGGRGGTEAPGGRARRSRLAGCCRLLQKGEIRLPLFLRHF